MTCDYTNQNPKRRKSTNPIWKCMANFYNFKKFFHFLKDRMKKIKLDKFVRVSMSWIDILRWKLPNSGNGNRIAKRKPNVTLCKWLSDKRPTLYPVPVSLAKRVSHSLAVSTEMKQKKNTYSGLVNANLLTFFSQVFPLLFSSQSFFYWICENVDSVNKSWILHSLAFFDISLLLFNFLLSPLFFLFLNNTNFNKRNRWEFKTLAAHISFVSAEKKLYFSLFMEMYSKIECSLWIVLWHFTIRISLLHRFTTIDFE